MKSCKSGYFGESIKWNWNKFLIDRKGKVVNRYGTSDTPKSFK